MFCSLFLIMKLKKANGCHQLQSHTTVADFIMSFFFIVSP